MSNLAIDQLFQINKPAPTGRESSHANAPDGEGFRAHLDRAAEVGDQKPTAAKPESDSEPIESADEPVETHSDHQETSANEQDQAAPVNETSDASNDNGEERVPDDEPTDEVTLSVAADAQVREVVTEAEQTVDTDAIVEATLTGDQNSEGQASQHASDTSSEPAPTVGETTEVVSSQLEPGLLDGVAAQHVGEVKAVAADAEAKPEAETVQQVPDAEIAATAGAAIAKGGRKQTESSSSTELTSSASAQQQTASEATLNLPESDSDENGQSHTQNSQSRNSQSNATDTFSVTTLSEGAALTDAELAAANLNTITEANANAPNNSNPATANEAIAATGKNLGTPAASRSTEAAGSSREASPSEAPTVDRARFVQRVGGAIRSAQQRDGQIQLRLSPPELGTLRIQLTVSEGAITAHLETENAAARTVLLDNLPALRERLAEQEITIEKFDVDVGREGQQQSERQAANERESHRPQSQAASGPARREARQTENLTETASPNSNTNHSGLDVRI